MRGERTALTIVCFWAAALFRERGYRKTGWLASLVAWAQWPAAVFDYVENIALWGELRGTIADPWPRIAFFCATIKFALVAAALEPELFSEVVTRDGMHSLSYLLNAPVKFEQAPELFCLDLFKYFDIDSLEAMAAPAEVRPTRDLEVQNRPNGL